MEFLKSMSSQISQGCFPVCNSSLNYNIIVVLSPDVAELCLVGSQRQRPGIDASVQHQPVHSWTRIQNPESIYRHLIRDKGGVVNSVGNEHFD